MDEETELTCCHGRAATCLTCSEDDPSQLWHSTPIKQPPVVERSSSSTLHRQRKELQLLVAELKDRERELNAMAASHLRERRRWEEDRRRAEALERRRLRVDEELQKRHQVIGILASRLSGMKMREEEEQKELQEARQLIGQLQEKLQLSSEACLHLQEQNQSLSSSVTALSTQLGSLQVRQEELRSTLQLKDRDVSEASAQNRQLSQRLRELRASLKESRALEDELLRDAEDNRRRFRATAEEAGRLREELQQQVVQSSSQREEIIRLKQELQLLHRQLSDGDDSWKDELLQLARSKQERLTSEVDHLRQVCEDQQNDLQQLRRSEGSDRPLSSQDELLWDSLDHRCPSSSAVKQQRHPSSPGSPERQRGLDSSLLTDTGGHASARSDESRLPATAPELSILRRSVTLDPCLSPAAASPQKTCETPPRS